MDLLAMRRTSSVLFAITAVGGAVMAVIRSGGQPHPPSWLAMVHGLLAGAGADAACVRPFRSGVPAFAGLALLLFVVAALGGVVLKLGYHLEEMALPLWLVVVHAAVAVAAFVLPALSAWGGKA